MLKYKNNPSIVAAKQNSHNFIEIILRPAGISWFKKIGMIWSNTAIVAVDTKTSSGNFTILKPFPLKLHRKIPYCANTCFIVLTFLLN
jgi:hypothetical protein